MRDKIVLINLGASEMILEACSHFHSFEGSVEMMNETLKKKIEQSIESKK